MPDRPQSAHLQDCLEAVHDASWQMLGVVAPETRTKYLDALAEVSAAWLAFCSTLPADRRVDFANRTASLLARIGDDLFYGRGHADEAIAAYELALSIAPAHAESLKGIIAAYLQGSERRPHHALPYAERLAKVDPSRWRDVEYIRSLIAGS